VSNYHLISILNDIIRYTILLNLCIEDIERFSGEVKEVKAGEATDFRGNIRLEGI